jgi:hypothetical protein
VLVGGTGWVESYYWIKLLMQSEDGIASQEQVLLSSNASAPESVLQVCSAARHHFRKQSLPLHRPSPAHTDSPLPIRPRPNHTKPNPTQPEPSRSDRLTCCSTNCICAKPPSWGLGVPLSPLSPSMSNARKSPAPASPPLGFPFAGEARVLPFRSGGKPEPGPPGWEKSSESALLAAWRWRWITQEKT